MAADRSDVHARTFVCGAKPKITLCCNKDKHTTLFSSYPCHKSILASMGTGLNFNINVSEFLSKSENVISTEVGLGWSTACIVLVRKKKMLCL